mgnify:CR=1 FL=1
MSGFETTNKSHDIATPNANFDSIPYERLSKLSFKDTIKLFHDSEAILTTDLLNIIKMILGTEESNKAKDRKIKTLVSMPQYSYSQRMQAFKIMKTSPEFKPHILLINSIAEDLYNDGVMPRINTDESQDDPQKIVAFSFNNNATDEESTFRLPDRQITAGDGSSLSLSQSSKIYYEDVNKPPIFESNLGVNKFAPLSTYQHAFMGLRYTEYDKENKRYTRKFFRLGYFGLDHSHMVQAIFNKKFPAEIRCQTDDSSSVSTQTPISASHVKRLVYNIYIYFRRYKYYQFYTRNCNTFVKEIADSIGVNNVSSLHDHIAPSLVANNAAKSISNPDGSVDCFADYNYENLQFIERNNELYEFCKSKKMNDFYKNSEDIIKNIGTVDNFMSFFNDKNFHKLKGFKYNNIKDFAFKEFCANNIIDKNRFINNCIEQSRKDINLFDKLARKRFKNPNVETNISKIATNIDDIMNTILQFDINLQAKNSTLKLQDTDNYLKNKDKLNNGIKEIKTQFDIIQKSIKETIKLAGKNQINLNVYLARTLNMLQKLIAHSTESFERDENLESQELQLKHTILMSELKERSNTPSNSEN